MPNCYPMKFLHLQKDVRKVCALVAATLILPALAYAGQNGQGGNGQGGNGQGGNGHGGNGQGGNNQGNIPAAPEANAGWVLVPFFGAVLLFSARQLFRAKAAQK